MNPALFLKILVGLYVLFGGLLFLGTFLKQRKQPPETLPRVSLVLAARNEETFLPAFFDSLFKLTYPRDKLEVFLVNDRSTDKTGTLFDDVASRYEFVHAIHIDKHPPFLSGKENALHTALEKATGEFIFLTDGDCLLPPNWIQAMLAHFDADTGVVCGQTFLTSRHHTHTIWEAVQALDWVYLLTAAAGAAGLNQPTSCIGNNMALRKQVYFQVGGFPHIGFSVTEDYALIRRVCQRTDWDIHFPIDAETTVVSYPEPTVKEFFRQRKRWLVGGKKVRFFGFLLMLASFLNHLILPVTLFVPGFYSLATAGFALVFATDALLLLRTLIPNKKTGLFLFFPFYEIFYFLYTLVLSLFAFSNTVHWKGTDYPAR